jgi:flagellar assembly protein FliH
LSKVFFHQDSPDVEGKKKFTPELENCVSHEATAFQVEWPSFQAKDHSFLSDPSMKEMEAKLLRTAKDKALLIEKEAYDQGFAQGERDGFDLGQKRSETIYHQLQKLFSEIANKGEDLYKTYAQEMLQLVFSITRKILQQDLPLPELVIQKTLDAAFQYVKEQKKVQLHLNSKDYEYLLARPELLPFTLENKDSGGVRMVVDPTITRGGCYLETSLGDIDATLESQLDQIASLIWEKVEKSGFPTMRLPQ